LARPALVKTRALDRRNDVALRALIVAVIAAASGACHSSGANAEVADAAQPSQTGSDAGSASDAAQASRVLTLRLTGIPETCGPYCPRGGVTGQFEGSGSSRHVSIRTLDGQPLVTRLQPGDPLCADGCAAWKGTVKSCDTVPSSDSLEWDGIVYDRTTFSDASCATDLECYQPRLAPPGRYLAHMCAARCMSTMTADGMPYCRATGGEDCVDLPFEYPGPALVEGSVSGTPPGAGAVSVPCRNPRTWRIGYADGTSSPDDIGFDECASGAVRRRKAVTCPPVPTGPPGPCYPAHPACGSDAECTSAPHGVCSNVHGLVGLCGCMYTCSSDDDCNPGSICVCNSAGGTCVVAICVDDASCPTGSVCASALRQGMGYEVFRCQANDDECLGDGDCGIFGRCDSSHGRRVCVRDCPSVRN
jgi:hypothetical protein